MALPTAKKRPSRVFAIHSGSLRSPIILFTDRMSRRWRPSTRSWFPARIFNPNVRSQHSDSKNRSRVQEAAGIALSMQRIPPTKTHEEDGHEDTWPSEDGSQPATFSHQRGVFAA